MHRILQILTIIGAAGYLVSLSLYVLTFWNVDAIATPVFTPLTFILFAIWLFAILKLIRDPEVREHQKTILRNPIPFFKVAFKGTPIWIQVIAGVSFIFAMASFAYLMYTQPGVFSIIDGKKVLHNRGDIIKELTDAEYREALAIQSRQFVGHYLAFFGVGTAILYPDNAGKKTISNNSYKTIGRAVV